MDGLQAADRRPHDWHVGAVAVGANAHAHAPAEIDAVDPANRLVAGELERRWNDALQIVHRIKGEIASIAAARPPPQGCSTLYTTELID